MLDEPERLRAQAVRLYAMALQIFDVQPAYAGWLIAEAVGLQDRAMAIETAILSSRAGVGAPVGIDETGCEPALLLRVNSPEV